MHHDLKTLKLLADIHPHCFSSFYTRGKLINGRIPSAPATLIIDLIKQCSFGCAFCFAGDTENRGRMFQARQLRDLLHSLKGIPKIVLIGGEPFEHPQLDEVLDLVCDAAALEVEIFTNGAFASGGFEPVVELLRRISPENGRQKIVLTLAVDECHKKNHGSENFERLINTFIRLDGNGWRTRFNVTDGRVYTGDYMDLPTMRAVMGDLSQSLLEEFERALVADRLTERFYINPLVAQGRQESSEPGIEYLRPADMLFSPELVLTLNCEGCAEYRSALNAAWMKNPPQCLVLAENSADMSSRAVRSLALRRMAGINGGMARLEYLLDAAVTGAMPERKDDTDCNPLCGELLASLHGDTDEGTDAVPALFAALEAYGDFYMLCRERWGYFGRLADRIWEMIEKPQPFVWDLSGYYNIDRLGLPVLRLLLEKFDAAGLLNDDFYENLLGVWRSFIAGGAQPQQACVFFERRNLGRLPDERGGFVPLDGVGLHSGFGDWPLTYDYVLKPSLMLLPGGVVRCGFDARIEWLAHDDGGKSAVRLLEFYSLLLPQPINAEFHRRLLAAAGPDSLLSSLVKTSDESDPFVSEAEFFFSDPQKMFDYATFDRNSNETPYGNIYLLRHLLNFDLGAFDPQHAEAWREKLRYHIGLLESLPGDAGVELSKQDNAGASERTAGRTMERIRFKGEIPASGEDFADAMRRMVAAGMEISLESDGVIFAKRSIAERMRRFGLRRVDLRLYGGTRFSHQLVKGSDDFYRALDGVRNLVECGVEVSVRIAVNACNHGTLKLAATELLKCGLRPDIALEFEDDPRTSFSKDIEAARLYAGRLCALEDYGQCESSKPAVGLFVSTKRTMKLDPQRCTLKARLDEGDEVLPCYSLLLRKSPGLYEIHRLDFPAGTSPEAMGNIEVVYTKNIRRLVFAQRNGKRHRLELESACVACRHLTRCPGAFYIVEETVRDFNPFGGAYRQFEICASDTRLPQSFAVLRPGERIAVSGSLRHFVLGDASAASRSGPCADLALLCDLAYAHGLQAVDYVLPEQSGSERFAVLYEKPLAPPQRVERMAVANISSACIANCMMCSMPQVFRGHSIGTIAACAMFEELKICGFQMVDTFGGEISLRGDLLALIAAVKRLNMISNIISTGYRLDHSRVLALTSVGLDKVQISIDSPDAELHDRIRGSAGLFEHACEAARAFRNSGRVFLEINSVILPENVVQIKRLHSFVVEKLGIPHHRLFYCVQIPTALTEAHHLSPEQARHYFEKDYPELLRLSAQLGSSIDFCPPVSPHDVSDAENLYEEISRGHYNRLSRCEAPQRDLFITPEGEIYPCVNPSIISRVKPLGRTGEIRIIDALRSEAMEEARRMAGLWPECASCISKR